MEYDSVYHDDYYDRGDGGYRYKRPRNKRRKKVCFILAPLVILSSIALTLMYSHILCQTPVLNQMCSPRSNITYDGSFYTQVAETSTSVSTVTTDGYPTTTPSLVPSTIKSTTEAAHDTTPIMQSFVTHINNENTCTNKACIEYARQVLQNMNAKADPCSDFYQFACGNFKKFNPIADSSHYIDNLSKHEKRTYASLGHLLQRNQGPVVLSVTQKFYSLCRNPPVDRTFLFKLFIDSLFKSNDITNIWATILSLNINNVIGLYLTRAENEMDNSYSNILLLRNNSENNNGWRNSDNYKRFIQEAFALFFGKEPDSYRETSDLIVKFESEFAQASEAREDESGGKYRWEQITEEILKQLNISNYRVGRVTLTLPYIHIYRTYDNGILKGYLKWIVIRELGFLSGNSFRKIEEKYSSPKQLEDRCKDFLLNYTTDLVYKRYIDTHLTPQVDSEMKSILDAEKQVFKSLVEEKSWPDSDTKELMIEKIDRMKLHVGHPGWNLDETYLFSKYSDLVQLFQNYSERNFSRILFQMMKINTKSLFDEFASKVAKDNFLQADMSYFGRRNEIRVNALYLPPMRFNPLLPNYVNYAGIGSELGHELAHGFIGESGEFDADGVRDYLLVLLTGKVDEKAKCFVDLYNGTRDDLTGMNLNGVRTRYENIADNIGLKVALLTYQNQNQSLHDKVLPGLANFTREQMFFIAKANDLCENRGEKAMLNSIIQSKNVPPKYRVIFPLRNNYQFSRAFNCNWKPKGICELW